MAQIRELQDKVNSSSRFTGKTNSLSDARDLHDPETASSSGASRVTSPHLTLSSSRTVPCRDAELPPDTRNIMGISGNVDKFEYSKSSASSSCGVKPEITNQKVASGLKVKPEQQDSPRSKAILHSEGGFLHYTGGQDKRRRAREGPEPAWVQTPLMGG